MAIEIPDNLRVFWRDASKNKNWNQWKKWKDCTEEEKQKANLREIKEDEIVLDDDKGLGEELINKLKEDGYDKLFIVKSLNGQHIHLFFNNLSDNNKEERKEIRREIIKKYKCDVAKSSEATLISIENKPHHKDNSFICKTEGELKYYNLSQEFINKIKKERREKKEKYENFKKDIKFDNFLDSDPLFKWVKQTKWEVMPDSCNFNNVIARNLAIAMAKTGKSKKEIDEIMKPIIYKVKGYSYRSFEGWLDKALSGEIDEYNIYELNNWAKDYLGFELYRTDDMIIEPSLNDETKEKPYAMLDKLKEMVENKGNDSEEDKKILNYAICLYKITKKYNSVTKNEVRKKIKEILGFNEKDFESSIEGKIEKEERKKEESKDDSCKKPRIVLPRKNKLDSTFAEEVIHKIKNQHVMFFRPSIRSIIEVKKVNVKNTKTGQNEIIDAFEEMTPSRAVTLIEKYITPGTFEFNSKMGQTIFYKKSISKSLADILLVSDAFCNNLPQIERVFRFPHPIIHKGKLTFPKRGYDSRFNSWLLKDAPVLDEDIPLEEAKTILKDILHDFAFKSRQDYTNAIAALLTPFLRGLYSRFTVRTPLFAYTSNFPETGKDYLAGITGILYEGVNIEESAIATDSRYGNDEELNKKLTSAFLQGRNRMHFSNNRGLLKNTAFEGILTRETFTERRLGKNERLEFDNEMEFSLSGNIGITFSEDLITRTIFINQHALIENPSQRNFKYPNLHEVVKNNRDKYLSCLFSLIKNWYDKECPEGSKRFRFSEWAKVCGGIMEAAGYDNPCKRATEHESLVTNQEDEDIRELFKLGYEKHHDAFIDWKDLKGLISENNLFSDLELNTRQGQTKLGNVIKKIVNTERNNIFFRGENLDKQQVSRRYKFSKNKPKTQEVLY